MDNLIRTIQEQIDLVMNSKCAKRTDAQLRHMEILKQWRDSDKNKNQFAQTGIKQCKFTQEVAKEIRDRFYYQNELLSDLASEFKIAEPNMRELLKNESYKVDDWNYPDYEKQKKTNKHTKDRIDEKVQFIKDGYGAINFCDKFQCSPSVYYGLVRKYKLQTPKRNGPNRAKNLVD